MSFSAYAAIIIGIVFLMLGASLAYTDLHKTIPMVLGDSSNEVIGFNIVIGNDADVIGSCSIAIGSRIMVPRRAVKARAHALIDEMSEHELHGGAPPFQGTKAIAHKQIDELDFRLDECLRPNDLANVH